MLYNNLAVNEKGHLTAGGLDTVDLAEKELRLTRLTERYEAELEARRTSYEETAASLGISTDALE